MPGVRATYNAIYSDVEFRYSDAHEWCVAQALIPSVTITGVLYVFRGGGMISQPFIWDADYDPAATWGPDDTDALLTAGVMIVRVEYPNGPQGTLGSRHQPFYRFPDNWRIAGKAIQFVKTHATDGRITGTTTKTIPTNYRKHLAQGQSAGASMAAMLAFAPDGALPYDNSTVTWNNDAFRVTESHRVGGCILYDFPTIDFRLFADDISSAAIPFLAVSERAYGSTRNTTFKKIAVLPEADRLASSLLPLVQLDLQENRSLGVMLLSNATSKYEASYLGSGLTLEFTLATGTTTGAVTVRVTADTAKSATIKSIDAGAGGALFMYAEPGASTNIADWFDINNEVVPIELVNSGGTIIATITDYTIEGDDTYKTFKTREEALAIIDAAGSEIPQFVYPHHVDFSALLKRERETIRDRHGIPAANWYDEYYLGSHYPAEISGDTEAPPYLTTNPALAWIEARIGI
jgi:hypothetical protein